MNSTIKNGKLLYHLTALSNIKSILTNGLKPRANLDEAFKDVAEQDIINFRNAHKISNTVPFHFFAGTPFAGRVQRDHPSVEFVYITIHRNTAKSDKNTFKIFPTHPKHMNPLEVFDYEEGFNKINWELMERRDYANNECKETCMAECVALHSSVPATVFHSIIVKSQETHDYIDNLYKELYGLNCKKSFYINIVPNIFIGI